MILAVPVLVAGCATGAGASVEPAPVPIAESRVVAAPLTPSGDNAWALRSWEDRHSTMTFAMLPNMARRFRDHRGEPNATLTCMTCHGDAAESVRYAMPADLPALDPEAWELGTAAEAVLATGRVDEDEAWRTFNMGLGMCLVLPEQAAEAAIAILADATVVGFVEEGEPGIRLLGD